MKLSPEESLWLLECVKGAFEEGHSPKVGKRRAEVDEYAAAALLVRLAEHAGVRVEDVTGR